MADDLIRKWRATAHNDSHISQTFKRSVITVLHQHRGSARL